MILSSDELEIIEYLKSYDGGFVSLVEICRSAGGRKKYQESPQWARRLMSRLVDEKLIEVNERGHYRYLAESAPPPVENTSVTEDYFAPAEKMNIVGDDYFPDQEPLPAKTRRWYSPQIEHILNKAGKKASKHRQGKV